MIWIIGEYAENPPSLRQDLGGAAVPRGPGGAPAPDLLGGDLDQLLSGGPPEPTAVAASNSLLGDIFGMGGAAPAGYVQPKQVWLLDGERVGDLTPVVSGHSGATSSTWR